MPLLFPEPTRLQGANKQPFLCADKNSDVLAYASVGEAIPNASNNNSKGSSSVDGNSIRAPPPATVTGRPPEGARPGFPRASLSSMSNLSRYMSSEKPRKQTKLLQPEEMQLDRSSLSLSFILFFLFFFFFSFLGFSFPNPPLLTCHHPPPPTAAGSPPLEALRAGVVPPGAAPAPAASWVPVEEAT